jgi:hypothetical protein
MLLKGYIVYEETEMLHFIVVFSLFLVYSLKKYVASRNINVTCLYDIQLSFTKLWYIVLHIHIV